MISKKTSKKREASLKNIPARKLRLGIKTKSIDSAKRLRSKSLIFDALWECLIDQDLESFKEILKSHIDVVGMSELSKKSKTSKRTMYRTLSENGNPTLKSLSKILNALYG